MIPEPPRPAERRLVHVLFVDLVGFTTLVEDLDAEDVALLQEHYFTQVAGLVAAAGGQVEKYIGDAVLATFGLPVLRPDDAGAAVRAGLAVIESLGALEARLGLPLGTLQARVGVHTGEVVVTWAADGTWRLSGDVVNTAARLQSAAEPGTVVVGPDTALAVEGAVDLVPLGAIPLKGKAEPVAAWRVAGRRTGPAKADGRFRGRVADLTALAAAHRDARGAERLTVLAPPGVGRSRLVEEFAHRAAGPAWLVRVRADEPGYAPVARLLRAAGAGPGHADPGHADPGHADPAGPDPTELADRLARHGHTGPRAALSARHTTALLAGEEPSGTPEELWTSWTAALDAHADPDGPTPVWILDDIHLASADMHAFLDHAIAAPHRTPRLVITTARPGDRAPAGAVRTLDPLTDDDVADLVADRIGTGVLPPEVLSELQTAAGGNPLFVVELLRVWERSGALPAGDDRPDDPSALTVPSTVRAIYLGQLDALARPAREVLGRGSVTGTTLPASALPELGSPEPGDALRDLTGAGLLVGPRPDPVDPASYTYRHQLVRDTAYATLPRARRAALHLRFADWLDLRRPDRGAEQAGRHLAAAWEEAPALGGPVDGRLTRAELATRAAVRLTEAGEAALVAEPLHAAELFGRARDLGVAADPAPSEDRAHRTLRMAEALRRAGRLPEAMAAFAEVADAAAPGTYPARAAAALGYEDALFDSRLPRETWGARALGLLDDALGLVPSSAPATRARLLAAAARAHGYGGDAGTATALGEEAVATARHADDPGALAYALLALRPVLAAPARLAERLRADEDLLAAARAAGDPEREFEALRLRMVDLLEAGETPAAEALADEAGALALRLGRPLHLWYPAMWRAMMLLHHGDPDAAADAVEHFRREGERWHYGDAGQVHGVQLLTQHTAAGTPELAVPTLVRTAREVGGRTWIHVAVGLARAGRLDEAAPLLGEAAAGEFAVVGNDGARCFLLGEAAETAEAVGDAAAGAVLHDLLTPWEGLAVVVGSGALCLGAADHALGLAARAAGDRDAAARHLENAVRINDATGAVHAATRSREALARGLSDRPTEGRPTEAHPSEEGRSRC